MKFFDSIVIRGFFILPAGPSSSAFLFRQNKKNLLEKAGIRKDIWTGNAPDPYLQMVALLGSFILFVKQVSWLTYHHLSRPSHRFLCNGFFRGRLLDHSDRIAGDSHSVPF